MELNKKIILVEKNDTYRTKITVMKSYLEDKNYDFKFEMSLGAIRYVIKLIKLQIKVSKKSNKELEELLQKPNLDIALKDLINEILLLRLNNNNKSKGNIPAYLINDYDKKDCFGQIYSLNLLIEASQVVNDYDSSLEFAKEIEKIIILQIRLSVLPIEDLYEMINSEKTTIQERKFIDCLTKYEQLTFESMLKKCFKN